MIKLYLFKCALIPVGTHPVAYVPQRFAKLTSSINYLIPNEGSSIDRKDMSSKFDDVTFSLLTLRYRGNAEEISWSPLKNLTFQVDYLIIPADKPHVSYA